VLLSFVSSVRQSVDSPLS